MVRYGKGHILNVSSISAVMPYPTLSYYGPTKAFMRKFSRALRTELRPYGVNVTCLLPGATDTSLLEQLHFNRTMAKKWRVLKDPGKVALAGMNALFRNRAECVPGWLNKFVVWFLPWIPSFIIYLIYRRLLRADWHMSLNFTRCLMIAYQTLFREPCKGRNFQ